MPEAMKDSAVRLLPKADLSIIFPVQRLTSVPGELPNDGGHHSAASVAFDPSSPGSVVFAAASALGNGVVITRTATFPILQIQGSLVRPANVHPIHVANCRK